MKNRSTFGNGKLVLHLTGEFLALLSALHLRNPDTEELKTFTDQQWGALLSFCETAHLTLSLAQLSIEGIPSWVSETLRANLADNALRVERIKATYQEAADALHRVGAEHIVIKGFTQAPDYVASPRLRAQSDIDLYCPPDSLEAARASLKSIGYQSVRKADLTNADHVAALVRLGDWQWKGNPFDPDMPLGIELHFCLWNEHTAQFNIPVEDFWQRRTTRTVDSLTFSTLSPIDHMGHLTLHILRNLFLHDWIIHHVRELAVFLDAHAYDDAFWEEWAGTHDATLQSIEAIAFYLARDWFGCALHTQAENAIAILTPLRRQWLNHFSGSALEGMFHQNKDSLWLHLTFLPTIATKWKIFRKTMIPPKIAPLHSPIVQIRNKRLVHSGPRYLWLQYVAYLFSRSLSHATASLSTLQRGLYWRLGENQLKPQFWIFLAASFLFDLGFSIYFFLFNLFLVNHGYAEKTLGLLASTMAVGSFVGAIPTGKLMQRYGLRRVLLSCFLLTIVISSTRVLLLSVSSQLVLAFLFGAALSSWAICLAPSVAQLTSEEQRPTAFSLIFSLGIGVGALGGYFGSRLPGWFAIHHLFSHTLEPAQLVLLLSCGIVALGIWPVTMLNLSRPPLTRRPRPLLSPFLIRFLPAVAVWSLVTGSFSPLATVYFAQHLHMTLPQIGNAFSLSQLAQVVAVLAVPLLFRRWSLVGGIVSTQIAACLMLFLLAAISSPLAATAAYISFSAFQWMNGPYLYSLLMNMVPIENRGGASASHSLTSSASLAVASALAGAAFTRYGYPSVLRAIGLIGLLAAMLFWNLGDHPSRQPAPVLDDVTG
jgi:predicted MFS family arabinose efflux permease